MVFPALLLWVRYLQTSAMAFRKEPSIVTLLRTVEILPFMPLAGSCLRLGLLPTCRPTLIASMLFRQGSILELGMAMILGLVRITVYSKLPSMLS